MFLYRETNYFLHENCNLKLIYNIYIYRYNFFITLGIKCAIFKPKLIYTI